MDSRINFFKVGLFVSIISFFLVVFIFWLGKYGLEDKKYDDYITYFSESVSGLNIGSSIKYKGFDVGVVKDIKIDPHNSERIQIDIQIQKGTPIKEDNFAVLGNLGITGLKYIELQGGSKDSQLLSANSKGTKIIASKRSALSSFVDSTEDITKELILLLVQIKKVLDDRNLANFSAILSNSEKTMQNIENFSSYLVKNQEKIDELLNSIKTLSINGSSSFKSVQESSDQFKILISKIQEEFDKGSFDIRSLTQDSLNSLASVLKSFEDSLNETQDLINNINESPSDLFLKQKTIKYGPGE